MKNFGLLAIFLTFFGSANLKASAPAVSLGYCNITELKSSSQCYHDFLEQIRKASEGAELAQSKLQQEKYKKTQQLIASMQRQGVIDENSPVCLKEKLVLEGELRKFEEDLQKQKIVLMETQEALLGKFQTMILSAASEVCKEDSRLAAIVQYDPNNSMFMTFGASSKDVTNIVREKIENLYKKSILLASAEKEKATVEADKIFLAENSSSKKEKETIFVAQNGELSQDVSKNVASIKDLIKDQQVNA